jgi:gluconokinase
MLLIFFGLPGAGKSYAARAVAADFDLKFHDGDDDLPASMVEAIAASQPITDAMRDEFFARLIEHVRELRARGYPLAVAQTFIKEKYRRQLLDPFPMARFILVEAAEDVRERRLANRSAGAHLEPGYARRMASIFEPPAIPHDVIRNDHDGDAEILGQVGDLLDSPPNLP